VKNISLERESNGIRSNPTAFAHRVCVKNFTTGRGPIKRDKERWVVSWFEKTTCSHKYIEGTELFFKTGFAGCLNRREAPLM